MQKATHNMPHSLMAKIAEDVQRNLLTIESLDDVNAFIDTPVMYPNGKSVVVHLRIEGDSFFVSDASMAGFEAGLVDEDSAIFSKIGKQVADDVGAHFDHKEFFFSQVSRDQLPGAVVMIAYCSQRAMLETMSKLNEQHTERNTDILYSKLTRIFPKNRIVKNAEVMGASNHKWPVAALVKAENSGKQAVFDSVNKHYNSINSSVAKFYDFKQLEVAPSRFAFIEQKKDFGNDNLALLVSLCSIIDARTSSEELKKALSGIKGG